MSGSPRPGWGSVPPGAKRWEIRSRVQTRRAGRNAQEGSARKRGTKKRARVDSRLPHKPGIATWTGERAFRRTRETAPRSDEGTTLECSMSIGEAEAGRGPCGTARRSTPVSVWYYNTSPAALSGALTDPDGLTPQSARRRHLRFGARTGISLRRARARAHRRPGLRALATLEGKTGDSGRFAQTNSPDSRKYWWSGSFQWRVVGAAG